MDFTYSEFEKLLKSISIHNIRTYTIYEWMVKNPDRGICLRHDVDRWQGHSLHIAELEKKYNILSTYYFRIGKVLFNPEIIQKIKNLGHEIGYHYEDLSSNNGDYEKAITSFERNLKILRKYGEIRTISMHGHPLKNIDNRSLWKYYDISTYGLTGEAYLDINYNDKFYITDTGRSWSDKSANVRDRASNSISLPLYVQNTKNLIDFIINNQNRKIFITSHPERWPKNLFFYIISLLKDITKNNIKKFIIMLRG